MARGNPVERRELVSLSRRVQRLNVAGGFSAAWFRPRHAGNKPAGRATLQTRPREGASGLA